MATARSPFRSERIAAVLLLVAAIAGLALANSPVGPAIIALDEAELGPAFVHLSVEHWISDGLLAIFFLVASIELKHELRHGELDSPSKALRPAIAAAFGVAVPAALYLAIAHGDLARGWPVPTATDIAFALGVLALFGRGLPSRIRAFLLALAVLDDLVAIILIAVLFTDHLEPLALLGAAVAVGVIAVVARIRRRWIVPIVVVLGIAAWWLTHEAGIHATIAGVAVGLVIPSRPAVRARHHLEPWVNGVILPLFAFSAALVAIPAVGISELSPVFWAVLVALPVGKLLGITLGGWIGNLVDRRSGRPGLPPLALVTVGALGGVGFTVSLLMNDLAFEAHDAVRSQGTLAVLAASAVAIVVSSVLVAVLARRMRHARR
jgi:Na+:H+ antiporter, NhaA family